MLSVIIYIRRCFYFFLDCYSFGHGFGPGFGHGFGPGFGPGFGHGPGHGFGPGFGHGVILSWAVMHGFFVFRAWFF
jgi:hypothetical protein